MATASSSKPHEFMNAYSKFIDPDLVNSLKPDHATLPITQYAFVGYSGGFIHENKRGRFIVVDKSGVLDGTRYLVLPSEEVQRLRAAAAQATGTDLYTQLLKFMASEMFKFVPESLNQDIVLTPSGTVTFTFSDAAQRKTVERTDKLRNVGKVIMTVVGAGLLIYIGARNPSILTDAAKAV